MNAKGSVFKYPDNVDTDVIIPARHLNTQDAKELASHCMEDIDKDFVKKVKDGDIMVGGWNFGCGSSRDNPNIGEIGNTNSINGISTKQLNNLYNSLGRDSECLRFIHCIYYTSAARVFIWVLFKLPLNTFIIVRFRLWNLLMKS